MAVPIPLLAPLTGASSAGVSGSVGLGQIAASTGLLAAAGGGLGLLTDGIRSPEKLTQKLMTTAMLDVMSVAQQSAKVLWGAEELRRNNSVIAFLKDLVIDIAGGAVGNMLFHWMADLITNEESNKEVEKDTTSCGDSVQQVNDRCGEQIDTIGQTTITAVTAMLQALSAVNPAANPVAYKQGLEVIANYINEASVIVDECITDRDNTMGELIEALVAVVEAQVNTPLNQLQPDLQGSGACAPCVSGGSEASASPDTRPATDVEVCEKPSEPATAVPPAPRKSVVGGELNSLTAVGQGGAQLGAAVTGFLEQLVAPTSASTTAQGCVTMASTAPGIAGCATLAGAAAIVGLVGDEISKFVQHTALNIQATIEGYLEQVHSVCEPSSEPVDAECERKPQVEPVDHTDNCEKEEVKVPAEKPQPAADTKEEGFDKTSLKPVAETQPASDAGFDKSALKDSPAETASPTAPTVQIAPPSVGSSAASSVKADSSIHSVGEW